MVSNTATPVLMAPIALAPAQTLAVEPYAFTMAMAASLGLASPVSTLVMNAGNYPFPD